MSSDAGTLLSYNKWFPSYLQVFSSRNMMKLHITGMHSQILHTEDGYFCPLCTENTDLVLATFEETKVRVLFSYVVGCQMERESDH